MTRILTYCLTIIISLALAPAMSLAETDLMSFSHYDTGAYTVKCAMRDNDGIVWLGTRQGLFTAAQLLGNATTKRPVHPYITYNIRQIQQDGKGRLWITTLANKYIIYDPKTGELVKDVEAWLGQRSIKAFYDFGAEIDRRGNVWIYKDSKVWTLNVSDNSTAQLSLPEADGSVTGAKDCKQGMLLLTRHALYLKPDNGTAKRLTTLPEDIVYQHTEIIGDQQGNFWIATHSRLYEYNAHNGQWTIHHEVRPDICDIAMLKDGRIMCATTNDGIYCFDKGKMTTIRHTAPITDGMQSNHLEGLFYDDVKDILAIFYHKHNVSVSQMNRCAINKHHIQWQARGYSMDDVIALTVAADGHIIAGTEDNGVYDIAPNYQIEKNWLPATTATCVMFDSKGKLWAGLYRKGLVSNDGKMFFAGQSPIRIIEGTRDRMFVLLNGEGLSILDSSTGATTHITTSNPWIMDMASDGIHIFAATPDALYIIDVKTLETRTVKAELFKSGHFKDGNKTILADSRGWVWMVNYKCGSDIDVYDTRRQATFTIHAGRDIIINAIAEDCNGNVWLASNRGLTRITVTDEKNHLTQTALFPIDRTFFNDKAAFATRDGLLLFGTTDGYVSVDTRAGNSQSMSGKQMPLILAALRINSDYMPTDSNVVDNGETGCALHLIKEIKLPCDRNNIWIELAPRDLDGNVAIYYYKVEGLNDTWTPLDRGGITLANLHPGTYVVKTMQDIQLSQEAADAVATNILSITVMPPFYRTVWAYIIYFLLLVSVVAMAMVYVRQKREARRKIDELYRKLELRKTPHKETAMSPADRQLLDAAIRIVEANIANPDFSVDELSAQLCMHRTNLYKRWPAITGITPLRFIRLLRLKHGRLLLEQGGRRISDVAYECGFNDPKKFSKYFKEEFGISPCECQ
ncbi:MAG: helix-turn-helix domain-containing protein [Prevotella sp.]